ncbi:mediator complex protein-domain-containing protein [Diplogelasinospora grovesii]|uniref:Mediator of RNA polymerase II transcription subunit 11 n=1 Tax=Diplogelasinospora grovesii TaxID=303347 RepID=A0AAN6N677_9PEZI|nr:mediator complex protein-domain-containing protein [Diplogelasinospora grovesii]
MDQFQPSQHNNGAAAGDDKFKPFTTAERMQQLSEIDLDIASLLEHTSHALRSIAKPPSTSDPLDSPSPELPSPNADPTETSNFPEIQSEFLSTLDRIDKHLKRQIYALEEAGIISLPASASTTTDTVKVQTGGPGSGRVGRYVVIGEQPNQKGAEQLNRPDGVGMYGDLDVGMLNAASSTVERDHEAKLWAKARTQLQGLVDKKKTTTTTGSDSDAGMMDTSTG